MTDDGTPVQPEGGSSHGAKVPEDWSWLGIGIAIGISFREMRRKQSKRPKGGPSA